MIVPILNNGKLAYEKIVGTEHVDDSLLGFGGFGDKVDEGNLYKLLDSIKEINISDTSSNEEKQLFDKQVAVILHNGFENLKLDRASLRLRGFWEWISIIYLPDIVMKRWPSKSIDRFLFGRRHCFYRLWLAADNLFEKNEKDPYLYVNQIFESNSIDEPQDFLLQVMERSFSGYKNIFKALIALFVDKDLLMQYGKVSRKFYRSLFIRLQHRQPVYCFADLSFSEAFAYLKKEYIELKKTK